MEKAIQQPERTHESCSKAIIPVRDALGYIERQMEAANNYRTVIWQQAL